MRKICFLLAIGLLLSGNVYAKHDCECKHDMNGYMSQGGFVDTNAALMSVADIKKQPEDTYVSMQGNITKRLSKDTYNFTDGSDNIVVEINKKIWRGQMISPKDKVLIYGETDRDDGLFMVDAKSIKIVK